MRKLFTFLFLSVLCVLLVACTKDVNATNGGGDEADKLEVRLECSEYNVSPEGGEFSIGYEVINGVDGFDIVATYIATWVKNYWTEEGQLFFDVEPNTTMDHRSTEISIKYPNYPVIKLMLIQRAQSKCSFEFVAEQNTTTSCKTHIIPSDPEAYYVTYVAEKEYLLAKGIAKSEQVFQDDYEFFMSIVEPYLDQISDVRSFFLLNGMVYQGEATVIWESMLPNKEYVVYAYAVEFDEDNMDYHIVAPVDHCIVTLEPNELIDVPFDVDVEVEGPNLTYNIDTLDWEGYYYLEVIPEGGSGMYLPEGVEPDKEYCDMLVNRWLSMTVDNMASGFTPQEILDYMCLKGDDSWSEERESDTNYMMYIYAVDMVDGVPQMVSKPQLVHFATKPVLPSEMTFEIKMENCHVRIADITVTPSKDDSYTMVIVPANEVPEGSNEEIITSVIEYQKSTYGRVERYKGVYSEHLNTLQPDMEYSFLAFGYLGGVATTDLFRYDFKTEPEGECQNSVIRVDFNGPYSAAEYEQYYPGKLTPSGQLYEDMGYYVMWSEIITEKPARDVFHYFYAPTNFMDNEHIAAVKADLITSSKNNIMVYTSRSSVEWVMCGAVLDELGNCSEMWSSTPFSYSYPRQKRDINELLDKLGYYDGAEKSVVIE